MAAARVRRVASAANALACAALTFAPRLPVVIIASRAPMLPTRVSNACRSRLGDGTSAPRVAPNVAYDLFDGVARWRRTRWARTNMNEGGVGHDVLPLRRMYQRVEYRRVTPVAFKQAAASDRREEGGLP